jgi:hypothetical protein
MFSSIPRDGVKQLAIQIGLTFFPSLFPFLCYIGAFDTIIRQAYTN